MNALPQDGSRQDDIHPALRSLDVVELFALKLALRPAIHVGTVDSIQRRVVAVESGTFRGEALRGSVLPGGDDWVSVDPDGDVRLDARIVLRTDAGATILMRYTGVRRGPAEVMELLARGEPVEPDRYYFRIAASFETEERSLSWLGKSICVGTGQRLDSAVHYNLFRVA